MRLPFGLRYKFSCQLLLLMTILVATIHHCHTLSPNASSGNKTSSSGSGSGGSITNTVIVVTFVNETSGRLARGAFLAKNTAAAVQQEKSSNEKPSKVLNIPRFSHSKSTHIRFDPKLYMCDVVATECGNKTQQFKEKVLTEFKKARSELPEEQNIYFVDYQSQVKLQEDARCMILNKARTLRKNRPPFSTNLLGTLFPIGKLLEEFRGTSPSCVIVSSAGSMKNSKLGKFIDAHDIVMRFNHAPTEGYELDVGKKTTIRIVNSQVVSKPEFAFLEADIFKKISIVAWDPGKYNGSMSQWLNHPDYDLFTNYKEYMMRNPTADVHLLDPRSVWWLWEALQDFTVERIRRNPPTSGFIGIALLLPLCEYISVVEYMPSTRLTSNCHYYDEEMNSGCTFGTWHPLAAEKLMVLEMNSADDLAVFQKGVLRIDKINAKSCRNN